MIPYDVLILATGARALPLPIAGSNLAGVLSLRTAADAEALKAALGPVLEAYPDVPEAL